LRLDSKILAARAFSSPSGIWRLETGGWRVKNLEERYREMFGERLRADLRESGVG
jgi:hypothetical protein